MGAIELKYSVKNYRVPIETIVQEFEYGSTFLLYPNCEEIRPSGLGKLQWVQYDNNPSGVVVKIDDSFWHADSFFEKFLSLCVYNLMDFGDVQLLEIDISNSILKDSYSKQVNSLPKGLFKGTIFKPYYHLGLKDKVALAERYVSLGCNIFKNDECFFLPKDELWKEALSIQDAIGLDAYFVPNVTSYVSDFAFMEKLLMSGIKIVMVDYLISGFGSIRRLKKRFPEITIWGHRIGYDAIKRSVSMDAMCVLAQLAGIDLLHIGTPLPHEIDSRKRLVEKQESLNPNFKPIFTKTTPELLEYLMPVFNRNAVYLACGYFRDKTGNVDWDRVKMWCDSFK